MRSLNHQKQRVCTLRGIAILLVLMGLTGCGTLQSTFAPPLVSPNGSQGSGMEKWDVEQYMDRKGPNPMSKEKLTRPSRYETFLNDAKEQYHAKKSQFQEYVSKINAEWTKVTSTFSGE